MIKVFISYTRRGDYDRQFADYLRQQLIAWGFTPWMDVYDIPSGDHWDDAIDAALHAADVVLGLISPASVDSDNVKNEWAWALQKGKLHLLRLAPCDIPHRFVRIDFIDFTTDQNAGMARLHKVLTTPALRGSTTSTGAQNAFKRISNTFRTVPTAASKTMARGGLPRGVLIGGLVGAAVTLFACVALIVVVILREFNPDIGVVTDPNISTSDPSQQIQQSAAGNDVAAAQQFLIHIFNGDAVAAANLTCPARRSELQREIQQIILEFAAAGGIQMSNLSCREFGADVVQCFYNVFSPATGLSDSVSLRFPMRSGFICPVSIASLTS